MSCMYNYTLRISLIQMVPHMYACVMNACLEYILYVHNIVPPVNPNSPLNLGMNPLHLYSGPWGTLYMNIIYSIYLQ